MTDAFWHGFWDNYMWIAIFLSLLVQGLIEGIRKIVIAWAKSGGSSRHRLRELEDDREEAMRQLARLRDAMVGWERWATSVSVNLARLNLQGLPPAPDGTGLENWPSREEADRTEAPGRGKRQPGG